MARRPRTLSGKVAAVTGGARGIGRATARTLAREGARVAIGDLDEELAQTTAEQIGHRCVGLAVDVTDRASFERFLDEVEQQLGPLDVLVNNAGILHVDPLLEQDDAAIRRMIAVNLIGVINGTKLALPRLLRRPEGHLVNVASTAGKLPAPGSAVYTATKHAVVGLTESVRLEHRRSAVEFSIVMPGVVRTEMIAGYGRMRAFPQIEADDVGEAIIRTLKRPRLEVWVPPALSRTHRLMSNLPRRAREAVGRFMGTERIFLQADHAARSAYETRAAGSDPGLERHDDDGARGAVVESGEAPGLPGQEV
jgi:NAD(P)-dependent dehydrogenase (short-subunit alcohol dehydrogenase family)